MREVVPCSRLSHSRLQWLSYKEWQDACHVVCPVAVGLLGSRLFFINFLVNQSVIFFDLKRYSAIIAPLFSFLAISFASPAVLRRSSSLFRSARYGRSRALFVTVRAVWNTVPKALKSVQLGLKLWCSKAYTAFLWDVSGGLGLVIAFD